MKLPILREDKDIATEKWREYNAAFKQTKDKTYDDLRAVYNVIKKGVQVIDVADSILSAGVRPETKLPMLAIVRANAPKVFARYYQSGRVFYSPTSHWGKNIWRDKIAKDELNVEGFPAIRQSIDLTAPTPIIPPRLRPAKMDDSYYILWEVDAWKMEISKDPYLLRRVRGKLMAVCGAWDLTDTEVSIMNSLLKK